MIFFVCFRLALVVLGMLPWSKTYYVLIVVFRISMFRFRVLRFARRLLFRFRCSLSLVGSGLHVSL